MTPLSPSAPRAIRFAATMIRLAKPWFDAAERDATARVLDSGMLVQGEQVRGFEDDVSAYLRALAPHAPAAHTVAVTNGTVALELALMVAGVNAGDEVIVADVSWPSPGNAIVLRGAVPVLVDIDPRTFNLDASQLAAAVTPRTRAVIAIDQFGVPADIPAVRAAVGSIAVVEDAACALGSTLHGVPCGLLGDVASYSFHPRKVITTGEGGMLLTAHESHAMRLRTLRNHGQSEPGVFREAGPNARLGEMQAAVGRAQMAKLGAILARRRAMADEMRAALALRWQGAPDGAVVNHQTLGFVLPVPASGTRASARDALVTALRSDGIEAGALSYAMHRLPPFAKYPVNASRVFRHADDVVDGGVAVPLHPLMDARDVATVIDAVRRHGAWALGRMEDAR